MFFVYHFIFWYLSFSLHEFSQPACLFFFIQSARQRRPKFGEVAGDSSGPDTVGFLVGQDGQYMAMELVSKWPNDLFHSEIAMYTSNIYIYMYICPDAATSSNQRSAGLQNPMVPRPVQGTRVPSDLLFRRTKGRAPPGFCDDFCASELTWNVSEEYGDISYDV